MNIIITNVYSYQNKGDAAIVLALVQEIRRVFNRPKISIQTADVKNDKGKYDTPVSPTLLWILLSSVRNEQIITRILTLSKGVTSLLIFLNIYKWTNQSLSFLLNKDLREFVENLQKADLIIACGGGYLRTSNSSPQNGILLLVTCLNILTGKFLKKPVYLYSQSIGPVHGKIQTMILKFTLKRVDLIEPREEVSFKYLKQLSIDTSIAKTADPALLLGGSYQNPKIVPQIKESKGLRAGITVRNWFSDQKKFEFYIKTMAKVIDYLVERHNATVYYIPQVIAKDFGDDDRSAALKVKDYIKHRDNYMVIDIDLHPFEVIGLCKCMDIFIGTRMHSNIFSLISKVPVIAIEYEHKTRGIMQSLEIEDYVINIEDANPEILKGKIELLLKNKEKYIKLLEKNLPVQIKKSKSAIEIIRDHYDQIKVNV